MDFGAAVSDRYTPRCVDKDIAHGRKCKSMILPLRYLALKNTTKQTNKNLKQNDC